MTSRQAIPESSIAYLIHKGAETFDSLCAAGLLDRSDWSEDEKWTAIGMMWDLSARNIGRIRYLLADADASVLTDDSTTYNLTERVRSKGKRILAAMSATDRRDWGLPEPPPSKRKDAKR